VLSVRPELDGLPLAPMTPITYPAADGTMIPAYLTLPVGSTGKGLPAIVMPHGGPSARDEWGFDWLVQFYAARGYAVLQPNYRGSSGFGADWRSKNGFQSWPKAIGDIDDAGRWLLSQGIAAPGKIAIVGWSWRLCRVAIRRGRSGPVRSRRSWQSRRSPIWPACATMPRTTPTVPSSISRSAMAIISRQGRPRRTQQPSPVPVMLFHGDVDLNVPVDQSRLMAERLRNAGKAVDYAEFKGLDHQLDSADARSQMLANSDAFLRKALSIAP
jgi:dipeptidyl aminopeptidase/acylaminoacyl peptidase